MKIWVRAAAAAVAALPWALAAQEPEKEAAPPSIPVSPGAASGAESGTAAAGETGPGVPENAAAGRGAAPDARDVPYPGTLTLKVSLDLERRLFNVRETIPAKPGPLTLLYPEWLPGNHAPRGQIDALAGLTIHAGERVVEWTRDPVNVYAFHLNVPAGASGVEVEFQFASAFLHDQGRTVVTPEILGVQWNCVVLYPAGFYVSRILIAPELTLPPGWQFASALDVEQRRDNLVQFKRTTLEMLVDSPLFAGRYFRSFELDPGGKSPVRLNVVADSAEMLQIRASQLAAHRRLVHETYAVLGPPHYDRYEFLLALSDHFSEIGLEHLRSSENRRPPGYFIDWEKSGATRDLLPHEFSHSWNGKYLRPAGLATPDFNVPMRNSLLWVYEGLTNYLGTVLAARSGLWSEDFARQSWASVAANLDRNRPGRAWRDLEDTDDQPIITPRRPLSWLSWQRTEDYYTEGQLIWLDVDTRIRELTSDRRSLDDFLRAFFASAPRRNRGSDAADQATNPTAQPPYGPYTYTLDDLVRALNAVAPYDWAGYFSGRLHTHGPGAPLDGLSRGGWRLVYTETPSEYTRSLDDQRKALDFNYSVGFSISTQSSQLTEVRWGGPAYDAGLTLGTTLIAVNGREYLPERLRFAIVQARADHQPIELLIKNLDRYRTVRIPYYDGLQYPQLQRVEKAKDRLGAIMKPRAAPQR